MANIKLLKEQAENLFSKRTMLLTLWQCIADNFYPERADFTTVRNLGEDFAANLTTSYPILARRDLGNSIGSMLRPTSKAWFHLKVKGDGKVSTEGKAWLERASGVMRRQMHDQKSHFARATKAGDHDFAAFGQCVIQTSLNKDASGLLYRCWHLRDVAWSENADGFADTVFRRWKPTARTLVSLFGDKVHQEVRDALSKDPLKEFEVHHCIMPSDEYVGGKKSRTPYVSVYYDVAHETLLEEKGLLTQEYTIPRWSTASESQYAYSPATVAALPDARLIQSMTRVILDAGEKAVTPPMVGVREAIRSDVHTYAGGLTWVDKEYDERLGEVLRPLNRDKTGVPLGMDMAADTRGMIAEAFFLNKITLPPPGQDMTAYEVGQRVQEYIRQAMPLFEPMESEYNQPICDKTFEIMLRRGFLGSIADMPRGLHGAEIEFQFESPLHDAVEREKGQRFLEAKAMVADAMALDPSAGHVVDAAVALRDVLEGIGVPAKWTRSEAAVAQRMSEEENNRRTSEMLEQMQQGADVSKTLKEAGESSGAPAGAQAPSPTTEGMV